ncbi:MAG: site-specific integrase, partial [Oscillospiraceae bacterium]|nr:site-specific integrase [Oscillospiraceae bacterium]
ANVGIVTETPKTHKSIRSLKLPQVVFDHLKKLLVFYDEQADKLGTKWIGDNNAVMKAYNGAQLSPMTPDSWLRRFCKRNKLRYVSIHSFRHFNATLLINAGVDVRTVQHCLGHAQASTTLNIYAHSFIEAQARASEVIANSFTLL